MAKRHAEPLVCHVPWKRFLPEPPPLLRAPGRRPRDGPELWSPVRAVPGGPGKKRKLEEAEAPPGKRPGLKGSKPGGESGDPASAGGTTRQQRGGDVGPRAEQAMRAGGVGLGARSPDPRGEERGTEELQIDQTYTLLKRWSFLITELLGYSTPLTCLFGVQHTDNSIIEKQCLHGVAAKSLVAPYRLTDVLHASHEHKQEFWQYNSFQYWRAPLPAIDLSVILDLDGENMTDARTTSRTEIIETEMET